MNFDIVETHRVEAVLSETTTPGDLASLFFDEKDVKYLSRLCVSVGKKVWGYSIADSFCLKYLLKDALPFIRGYLEAEQLEPVLTLCAHRVPREAVTVTKSFLPFQTRPLFHEDYGFEPDTPESFMKGVRDCVSQADVNGTLIPWVRFEISLQGEYHQSIIVNYGDGPHSSLDKDLQSHVKAMVDWGHECDVEMFTYNHVLTRFDRPELV